MDQLRAATLLTNPTACHNVYLYKLPIPYPMSYIPVVYILLKYFFNFMLQRFTLTILVKFEILCCVIFSTCHW